MRILFMVLLGVSCSLAQPMVYPLHVGNMWIYHYAPLTGGGEFTVRVVRDSTMQNGKTYAVMVIDSSTDILYQRQQGDSIYFYDPSSSSESLFYDFSRAVGDTVSTTVLGLDTMDIVLIDKYLANVFGISRPAWVFAVNRSRRSIDDEYTVVIVDSLGLFSRTPGFGDPYGVRGALINGLVYGIVEQVPTRRQDVPASIHLWQNFPNPFNPSTTVRFSIPVGSRARFEVVNQLGQTMLQRTYSNTIASEYSLRIDGTSWPTGVYFFRLITQGAIETRKMILQK